MFKNNLKIALRNLQKQKGYAFLNVAGLAVGLACCLFIGLWTRDELGFDGFHEKADRIRRMNSDVNFGGAEMTLAGSADPLASTVLAEYPQVEAACRIRGQGLLTVRRGEEIFSEQNVLFTDGSLFEIFTFPMLEGDPKKALTEPNSVVISEKIARKYFGEKSPIGQPLHFDGKRWTAQITGVMAEIPSNSHLKADFFISMPSLESSKEGNWLSMNFNTYLLFRDQKAGEKMEAEWPAFARRHLAPIAEKTLNTTWEDFEKGGNKVRFSSIPLLDLHLRGGQRQGDLSPNGSLETLRAMVVIGLFILLLAVVNFMNLSTARASGRAREVGVRKVMGSQKGQLVAQFLSESVLMSLLAGLPALLFVRLFLPFFNRLSGKEIALDFWQNPSVLGATAAFILLTGLLAGIYPAFVLSGFRPIKVLKGEFSSGKGATWLRGTLVTGQFAISVALIIGALVTWRQMRFIQHKNLGFDRSQVLVLNNALTLGEKSKVIKAEVLALPTVESGTVSGFLPTNGLNNDQAYFKSQIFRPENGFQIKDWWVDSDYLGTLKIPLVDGRNFDPTAPADSNAVLINRAAAKLLGNADGPLGQEIFTLNDPAAQSFERYQVVGVVENFHFESLRSEIAPLVMHRGNFPRCISFRLKTADLPATIAQIEAIWKKNAGGLPFDFEFMDDQFDQLYRAEKRAETLALVFAGLAILIACLGLFGLAAFTAERRTKEIGIRKTLGASVASVVGLLSKDFLKWVAVAFLLAAPAAYFLMEKWLADFAFRIKIGWEIFALAAFAAVGVAFLTVSFQAIKAALADPVKSLRSE